MNLARLRQLGFDESKHIPFTDQFRVRCSCCDAIVVNGIPLHERGCPNEMHECRGCNALIPTGQEWCDTCNY